MNTHFRSLSPSFLSIENSFSSFNLNETCIHGTSTHLHRCLPSLRLDRTTMALQNRFILQLILVAIHTISYTLSFSMMPAAFTRGASSSFHPMILFAKGDGETGGAALAKPAVKLGQKTAMVTEQKSAVVQKKKAKTSEPIARRDEEFQDAPMYKVILVGDDAYDQAHVVERMCAIFEDMDENKAAGVFKQAQQGGTAMCGKYPYEYAELYKEQLLRSDPMIYSDVEEENKDQSGKGRKNK